ncbi:Smr/MutS family protein [Bradymonas sediminis]|uniref:Uncharacterized protein n=1 Tax=Bradymonas sediminis TaxID=1548548 RepID=A0A2Z4FQH6_9DELT|nr:Smr/MutS family protein [Bradymonas sediminis]AWV90894.1 hypothetical protein DN745_16815 [Bradymonas sediminis]TDP75370.1 DNA-nicking Smr family endonuclease [Bradymonas sediminis]
MSKKKSDKSPFAGLLAEKLKALDLDLKESPPEADKPAAHSDKHREKRAAERDAYFDSIAPDPDDTPPLSDAELFEKSIREMAPEDVYRKKSAPAHTLASKLGAARGARYDATDASNRQAPKDAAPTDTPAEDAQPEATRPLTDAELFKMSVQGIAPEDIYRGKFAGEGPKLPPPQEDRAPAPTPTKPAGKLTKRQRRQAEEDARLAEEYAREAVGQAREMRLFEKTVGKVDKVMRSDKYRLPSEPDPVKDAERRTAPAVYSSESPESLITPPLPKSGEGLHKVGAFDPAQRDLYDRYKKRSRQHEVPELNVRGDVVEDALRQVELFVHLQCKEKRRFVRIIHGRGLQSDGLPVLKPAILHWLEGPGFRYVRGYVPERNSAGDYGSLIVELEREA